MVMKVIYSDYLTYICKSNVCEVISIINRKTFQLLLGIFIGIILSVSSFTSLFEITVEAQQLQETSLPKKGFDMKPFFWAVGIVGGCIAITLGYVSWRKYKAEEKKSIKKDTSVD